MVLKKLVTGSLLALASASVFAGPPKDCPVTYEQLRDYLGQAQAAANGGLGFDMWGTVVNKDGRVCAVARTGENLNDQWFASRAISAQKAYTAATLNNNGGSAAAPAGGFAFSTAALYPAVQPGGPLFGVATSNPVDTKTAYAGNSARFGAKNDPLVGKRMGGLNTFGGGLALFDAQGQVVGAVGVSGDTSCADHNIARRLRGLLAKNKIAQGP
ncbi:MAG: GlcG/HbpS family heme-binding protein, partial [Gammaproteobacteria bacterium]